MPVGVILYTNIAPRTKIQVGWFLNSQDLSNWLGEELPPKLDALAASLGLSGIRVRHKPCEIDGVMLAHRILPDDVIQTILQQYQERNPTN